METARQAGLDVCFANPGTTEMDLVAALDAVPGIRSVLCLFEGVVTGAADGYARIKGVPALTLTHLGPGFANGIANLHNARRAGSPVVNLIGDHAGWHLGADAPLTSDIDALAGAVSAFVRRATTADGIGRDMADAIQAATGAPSCVASLIVPQDAAWGEVQAAPVAVSATDRPVDRQAVEKVAARLHEAGAGAALLVGGVVTRKALAAAHAIRAKVGCRLLMETFPSRAPGGRGTPAADAVPYFPEQAVEALGDLTDLVVAGSRAPVAFFGYRSLGRSHLLPDGCSVHALAGPGENAEPVLTALAEALDAKPVDVPEPAPASPVADGPIDVMTLGGCLAAAVPENAIVVNEAATSGFGFSLAAPSAAPHDVIQLTGGAIGQGLPSALGAAIAAPDRKVIAFQADGSAMYTLQSLWTMAREQLDVTTVICSNRAYRILQFELGRTGNVEPGPNALAMTDLSRPDLDWTSLAKGMGVPARRVTTTAELRDALRVVGDAGPALIEAEIAG